MLLGDLLIMDSPSSSSRDGIVEIHGNFSPPRSSSFIILNYWFDKVKITRAGANEYI